MNKARAKGTEAESAARDDLRRRGYRFADRLTLHGAKDVGDVRMGDGIPVVVEVKGGQKAVTQLGSHVQEMLAEVINASAETGVVIAKKARSANPAEWFAVMPFSMWVDIMLRLYPPPPPPEDYDGGRAGSPSDVRPRIRIRRR